MEESWRVPLALAAVISTSACDQQNGGSPVSTVRVDPAPVASSANATVGAAASSAKQLVEAVVSGDVVAQQKALRNLDSRLQPPPTDMPPASAREIRDVLDSAKLAEQSGYSFGLGMAAVDMYRRLLDAEGSKRAPVPLAVSFLDHAGLKIELLLMQSTPDWISIRSTVRDAAVRFADVRKTLHEPELATTTSGAIIRLQAAATARDPDQTRRAVQELRGRIAAIERFYNATSKKQHG